MEVSKMEKQIKPWEHPRIKIIIDIFNGQVVKIERR